MSIVLPCPLWDDTLGHGYSKVRFFVISFDSELPLLSLWYPRPLTFFIKVDLKPKKPNW